MTKFIIPLRPMLAMLYVLAVSVLAQVIFYSDIQSKTVVWKGACSFQEWNKDSDSEILMKVKCEDGNISDVKSSDAFLSVLYGKTNEFQCERQENGKTSCVTKGEQK